LLNNFQQNGPTPNTKLVIFEHAAFDKEGAQHVGIFFPLIIKIEGKTLR